MATMVAAGRARAADPGQVLDSPGDLDYDLIVVVSGGVEVVDEIGTEDESVLVCLRPAPVRR